MLPGRARRYVSATSTGLFEQTREDYGEIWYELGGRTAMSRATTAEGVLETIYDWPDVTPPAESEEAVFRGHPLAAQPTAPRRSLRRLAGGDRGAAVFATQESSHEERQR